MRRKALEPVMNEQKPLPYWVAAPAVIGCVTRFVGLIAGRRIHQPTEHVGMRLHFANGTSARVYRETVVEGRVPTDPCVLMVEFKLRFVRSWGHTLFRYESVLNTPLFVGFPGYVSKLWLAHDEEGVYRGVYDWDGPARAEHYARSLWQVLALVSVPGSIHYVVLPGVRRDDLIAMPEHLEPAATNEAGWWRLVAAA
jgi:hypothetical protein